MPGQNPSEPGWYPDENGTMRWFDGSSWTDHVQPGSAPDGPPTGPVAAQGVQSAYGAVPPASPPPGPPGSPGAPFQQGQPAGPPTAGPPADGSGGRKGLLIALVVIGVLALVGVIAVGAWALTRDDDGDGGGGGGGEDSSLPEETPEEVVEQFVDAARAGDCEAADELLTDDGREAFEIADCEQGDMGEISGVTVGEAEIDEDADPPTATVPLSIDEGGELTVDFELVVEDGAWRIDDYEEPDVDESASPVEPSASSIEPPTDFPTELPSGFPTDLPTDIPTDPEELESYLETFLDDFTTSP